jgi:hypothetical protein
VLSDQYLQTHAQLDQWKMLRSEVAELRKETSPKKEEIIRMRKILADYDDSFKSSAFFYSYIPYMRQYQRDIDYLNSFDAKKEVSG